MAILINEFLPNPIGTDLGAEWLELKSTESQSISLAGWHLENSSGKSFYLSGKNINPGENLLVSLPKGFSLRNSDGAIALYDQAGIITDKTSFLGTAPEGLSWSRQGPFFAFAKPTPGLDNAPASFSMPATTYGEVAGGAGSWEIFAIALCWGLLVGVAGVFLSHWYYESKKLLT